MTVSMPHFPFSTFEALGKAFGYENCTGDILYTTLSIGL